MKTRSLKIELAGDFFSGKTHPKIRLQGKWLSRLGFPPGGRVEVVPGGDGVLELRAVRPSPEFQTAYAEVCAALERADALLKERVTL
jgi:hypothetical protein